MNPNTYKWNSADDFAESIKAKYPEYKDKDNADLTERILQKYPVYRTQIKQFGEEEKAAKEAQAEAEQGETGLRGVAEGVKKGATQTFLGLGTLASKGLKHLPGKAGEFFEGGQKMGEELLDSPELEAKTTAEKIGKTGEQIAEFFVPAGKVAKLEAILAKGAVEKAAPQLAKLLGERAAKLIVEQGAKATVRGIEGGGIVALQSGGDVDQAKKAGAISAALGPAALAVKGVAKGVRRGISEVSGAMTGQGYGGQKLLRESIEAGGEARKAATDAMRGKTTEGDIVDETIGALDNMKRARSENYVAGLKKLEGDQFVNKDGQLYIKKVPLNEAGKPMNQGKPALVPVDLSTRGIKSVATKALKEIDLGVEKGVINFKDRPSLDARNIQKIYDTVKGWKDVTPLGLNRLRQEIAGFEKGGLNLSPADKRFNLFINRLEKNVKKYVEDRVPQIKEMNKNYAEASQAIDDIQQSLNLRTKAGVASAYNKFTSILRNNNEAKAEFLKELDKASGGTLLPKIAGSMANPVLPRGLTKYFTGGTAVTSGAFASGGGGAFLTAMKAALAAGATTSPRLAGEITRILGVTAKHRKAIQAVLDKMLIENPAVIVETTRKD